jgi:hypothetical protein
MNPRALCPCSLFYSDRLSVSFLFLALIDVPKKLTGCLELKGSVLYFLEDDKTVHALNRREWTRRLLKYCSQILI